MSALQGVQCSKLTLQYRVRNHFVTGKQTLVGLDESISLQIHLDMPTWLILTVYTLPDYVPWEFGWGLNVSLVLWLSIYISDAVAILCPCHYRSQPYKLGFQTAIFMQTFICIFEYLDGRIGSPHKVKSNDGNFLESSFFLQNSEMRFPFPTSSSKRSLTLHSLMCVVSKTRPNLQKFFLKYSWLAFYNLWDKKNMSWCSKVFF